MRTATLIALSMLAASGCVREHRVELSIDRGITADGSALSIEIHEGATCEEARSGSSTPRVRAVIEPMRPLPALPAGRYAIVVRGTNRTSCALEGLGCREVDPSAGRIEIRLDPATSGPCLPCNEGQCAGGGSDGGTPLCGDNNDCAPPYVCCGRVCLPPSLCPGECGTCGSGLSCCGTQCVDRQRDPSNCGECFQTCDSGVCAGGSCSGQSNRLRITVGIVTSDLRVGAYWFQLDDRDPDPVEQVVPGSTPVAGTGMVELDVVDSVPAEPQRVCVREASCLDETLCACQSLAGEAPVSLAFGLVAATGTGATETAYADVVLVWASRDLAADELEMVGPGLGLRELLPDGAVAGVLPYEVRSPGGPLLRSRSGYDITYSLDTSCPGGSCTTSPPLVRRTPP